MSEPVKKHPLFIRRKRFDALVAVVLLAALVVYVLFVTFRQPFGSSQSNNQNQTAVIPVSTATNTLASTVDLVPTSTATVPAPLIQTQSTPTPIPESVYLEIAAHGKYFYLGCEAAAAVDLAGYYDVLIYQYNFQHELPLSDNPDLGFVGDANGPWGQVPPYAYGVYARPVADLLQKYGVDVEGGKGYTLEQVKERIAAGHPVIVWVIGNMIGGVPAEYADSKGNTTVVAAYEHVVILTGYDKDSVRYANNGRFYEVPNEVFLNSWGVLGNMAVFHK